MTIHARIKAARKAKGMTEQQLADLIGVTRAAVQQWEREEKGTAPKRTIQGKVAQYIDGVYVMAANDRLYVKRVRQRLDGSVEISSDNANVKTVDVLNGGSAVDVLGRVVWCWNGRKL